MITDLFRKWDCHKMFFFCFFLLWRLTGVCSECVQIHPLPLPLPPPPPPRMIEPIANIKLDASISWVCCGAPRICFSSETNLGLGLQLEGHCCSIWRLNGPEVTLQTGVSVPTERTHSVNTHSHTPRLMPQQERKIEGGYYLHSWHCVCIKEADILSLHENSLTLSARE